MLIILSGSSGCGKTTAMQYLTMGNIDNKLDCQSETMRVIPTITTRSKRQDDGTNYIHTTLKGFTGLIRSNEFFEYKKVYGNYYGTRLSDIASVLSNSEVDAVKAVDVEGSKVFIDKIPSIVSIFITVSSSEILKRRILDRSPIEVSDLEFRISKYEHEAKSARVFKWILNNDAEVTQMLKTLVSVLKFERSNSKLLATQTARQMDENRVLYWISQSELPPISVAFYNDACYIIDGHHRYLAHVASGKHVAFKVVQFTPDIVGQYDWQDSLEYFTKWQGMNTNLFE